MKKGKLMSNDELMKHWGKPYKKTIDEVRDYLIENRTYEGKDFKYLDLTGLDFTNFDGNIVLNNIHTNNNLLQSFHTVKGNIWQTEHEVEGSISQDAHHVKGDVYQGYIHTDGKIHEPYNKSVYADCISVLVEELREDNIDLEYIATMLFRTGMISGDIDRFIPMYDGNGKEIPHYFIEYFKKGGE